MYYDTQEECFFAEWCNIIGMNDEMYFKVNRWKHLALATNIIMRM